MIDRIADPWGARTPYAPRTKSAASGPWPVRVDQLLEEAISSDADVDRWVQSAAVLHSNGDGIDIAVKDGRIVGVRGRAVDRVNRGRLDPKDLYGWQANNSADRLTRPLVREGGELVESDWDTAMGRIVERSQELLADAGGWGRFGFYTSGQLFLEEYYTLAVIGKAGLGTPHMDGNTRLCTATAAAALKASFGTDGQPGSYARRRPLRRDRAVGPQRRRDPDGAVDADARPPARRRPAADARRRSAPHAGGARGRRPPRDPQRHEPGADERAPARAHRARLVRRRVRRRAHPRLRRLERVVAGYDVRARGRDLRRPARQIEEAAELLGTSQRLLSTVLQGFYQSNQATAAACQVNNLHLLRGMIGRPGAGLYQMNGQPTAQNTRETGADGDLPGFRNWDNTEHIRELAELWNVDEIDDPALGAADARDADLPLRRAGLDRAALDLRDQPGGLAARARARPADPRARTT